MATHSVLQIDGCKAALIGYFQRPGQQPLLVYDYIKLVACFVKQGMTEDEANEWVTVNVESAWMGEGTPAILHRIKSKDDFADFCDMYDLHG
jgi:hypothetical protein